MSILYLRDSSGNIVPVTTIQGAPGDKGFTFTPSVSGGVLSWSNDGGLENPPDFDFAGVLPVGIQPPEIATVGQTIVVKAVDENGKPIEWEAVDFPSGGVSSDDTPWEKFATVSLTEETSSIEIALDDNGNEFKYKEIIIRGAIMHNISNTSKECTLYINGGRCASGIKYPQNTNRPMYLHAVCGWDYCRVFYIPALTHANPAMTNYQMAGMVADNNAIQGSIRKIKINAASDAPFSTSTSFSIWGR